jgi:hypothetical protein
VQIGDGAQATRHGMPILPGDTWVVELGGHRRTANVIRAAETPGWWHCVDAYTGVSFAANECWFVERLPDESDLVGDD